MSQLIATQSNGALMIWQRSQSGALTQVGQLAAGSEIGPELFAGLVGDLSDALDWQGVQAAPRASQVRVALAPPPSELAEPSEALSGSEAPDLRAVSRKLTSHPALLAYHAPLAASKHGPDAEPRRSKHVVRAAILAVLYEMPERQGTAPQIAGVMRARESNLRHSLERLHHDGQVARFTIPLGGRRSTIVWRLVA